MDWCKRYLLVVIGCLIGACGFNLFLIPLHLLTGGLSGIAIIFHYLWNWPIGVQLLVLNLPVIYLAYRVFGRLYAVDTVIGTVLFSVCVDATSFLNAGNYIDDIMLGSVFGGVLAGIGFGIVFRANANTGGLDVVGAVVKKYYSYDIGSVIFALNFIIIIIGILLFDLKTALFTLISIYITGELTNQVVAGFNRKKSVMIISPQSEHIASAIMQEVNRGVTMLSGKGAFTQQEKDILFVVVSLTQVSKIKLIVDVIDPAAFMIVSDTAEVLGRGFTLDSRLTKEDIQRIADAGKSTEAN